jgi:uncharacterized protein YciI
MITRGENIMPYLIHSKDKPGQSALRDQVRPTHIDYLKTKIDKILAGGALLADDGGGAHGSVIIYDTEDRAEAEEFAANDPFTKAGLFESVTVTRWRKAIFDGGLVA